MGCGASTYGSVEEYHAQYATQNRGGDDAYLAKQLGLPKLPFVRAPTMVDGVAQRRSQRVATMRGPTDKSNWVIAGRVLQGAYPIGKTEIEQRQVISALMRVGVGCFVNLVSVQETMQLPDYSGLVKAQQKLRPDDPPAAHVHFPIVDGGTAKDSQVLPLLQELVQRVRMNQRLYIHCYGGHGRAGTICACLLGILYELPPDEAIMRIQVYHDSREESGAFDSPACEGQRKQVRRLMAKVMDGVDIDQQTAQAPMQRTISRTPSMKRTTSDLKMKRTTSNAGLAPTIKRTPSPRLRR